MPVLAQVCALLSSLPEYRAPQRLHPLSGTLTALFLSKIAGSDGWDASADWIDAQFEALSGKIRLWRTPPSADTLRRMAEHFGLDALFAAMRIEGGTLHIDGKRARGAHADGKIHHFIEAFRGGRVVGMVEMEQGAEGPAIMDLLRQFELDDVLVTIDAAGTTPAVIEAVVAQGGSYLTAVEANQRALMEDIKAAFDAKPPREFVEKNAGHGRHEVRRASVISDPSVIARLRNAGRFPGIRTICKVVRTRITADGIETTVQFHITDRRMTAREYLRANRSHWAIEAMHHVLDGALDEDRCRIAKAAAWVGALRRLAYAVIAELRGGMSFKRFAAKARANPAALLAGL